MGSYTDPNWPLSDMANDEPYVFEEAYKGRIIEALHRGNPKRPWWAIVDGRKASPSRGTTSTFTSPQLALKCARDMVDAQIGSLSQMRIRNPDHAVTDAEWSVKEAEEVIRRTSHPSRSKENPKALRHAQLLLIRVKHDLALAEAALAAFRAVNEPKERSK